MTRKKKQKEAVDATTGQTLEELSKNIKQLSESMRTITHNKHFTERAMLVLLHDSMPRTSRPNMKVLKLVIDHIAELDGRYCK